MGNAVDPTGLSFTVTKIDGTTASVSPQTLTPTTWGDTAGTQTCTFTYSDGYDSVSCEVEATVLAEELSSIAVSGTPSAQTELVQVNPTGLTVTATYNSGRTADVTSSVDWTDFNTGTANVGSVWAWDGVDDYGIADTKLHASYTEGGVTKTADSTQVLVAPTANVPNTYATAYELESGADAYLTLDARPIEDISVYAAASPYDDETHGFFVEGASAGDAIWMTFTKDQYDNDTEVSLMGDTDVDSFYDLIITAKAKTVPDTNSPCWWDGCDTNGQSWMFANAVTEAVSSDISVVTVVGKLKTGTSIAAGGAGTIHKSMIDEAATYWVNITAPSNP